MVDADIKLVTNQQNKGIELNKDHQNENGADWAIYFIVSAKFVNPVRK